MSTLSIKNANILFQDGKYKEAISEYEKIICKYPNFSEIVKFNLTLAKKKLLSNIDSSQFKNDISLNNFNSRFLSKINRNSCPELFDKFYKEAIIDVDKYLEFADLVSIIIPNYNNAVYLRSAINSARSQVGVNVEIIVVDDGSHDVSLQIAYELAKQDERVRVIPLLQNFGCYYARNIGVINANGEFICFLDSDDIIHPERVLLQMRALRVNPDAMACLAMLRRWSSDFKTSLNDLKYGENTLFVRREVFRKIGYFDTVKYSGDSEFRCRIKKAFRNAIIKLNDELYFLRTVEGSLTTRSESRVFKLENDSLEVCISPDRKDYEKAYLFWQESFAGQLDNLYMPFPQFKRPFDLGNCAQNASPSLGEKVVGKMASYPPREAILQQSLPTILPQLHHLIVYLNGYSEVPNYLRHEKIEVILGNDAVGDLRDNGKFFNLSDIDGYVFTLDDDILYPEDYVMKMIHFIEIFQRSAVVGVHGVNYPQEKLGYTEKRSVFAYWEAHKGNFVDLIGTGTAAFHSSTLNIDHSDFKTTGVCDLWFARACHLHGIPLFSIPRNKEWMREVAGTRQGPRLYDEALSQKEKYRDIYHEYLYPVLQRYRPSRRAGEAMLKMKGETIFDLLEIQLSDKILPRNDAQKIDSSRQIMHHVKSDNNIDNSECWVHMFVVVTGWNCSKFVTKCLRSLVNQLPGHYVADFILIDDGSTDNTIVELANFGLLPNSKIIRNADNYGPAYSRHLGIMQVIDPEAVIVLVDMDDELKPDALREVASRYINNPNCLLTIGNWESPRRVNPHPFYSSEIIDSQSVRDLKEFYATHLRSFRRKLYDAVQVEDLKEPSGAWFQTCTDVAIMLPLLDQCYSRNVEFIDKPIYKYNERHGFSTLERFGKAYKQERFEWIRSKPPKTRFEDKLKEALHNFQINRLGISETFPTLIVGNPRSGARMCANVLHQHPSICVTDEMLNFSRFEELISIVAERYFKKYLPSDVILKRKDLLAKILWVLRSGDTAISRFFTASHIVNKTPRLEHHFDLIEKLFHATPPNYIYCVRDAFGVLRSVKNLSNLSWHQNTFDENLKNYLSSLRQFELMRDAAKERIIMINLASLNNSSNFTVYKCVFDLMGFRNVPVSIQNAINSMGPQNSLHRVREKTSQVDSIVDLTNEEIAIIENDKEYQKFAEIFSLKKKYIRTEI